MQLPWKQYDKNVRKFEVNNFFDRIAAEYDKENANSYWEFSDHLLWKILKEKVFTELDSGLITSILDAGVGTARWSIRFLDFFPNSCITAFDSSKKMLVEAEQKIKKRKLENRIELFEDDIDDLCNIKRKFDIIICFHNVIGFNANPQTAIDNLCNQISTRGTLLLVLPNFYHALWHSFQNKRLSEIDRILNSYSVKYTDQNPEVLLFTNDIIHSLLKNWNFKSIKIYGFPFFSYPKYRGDEYFDLQKKDEMIKYEYQICTDENSSIRGKNLLVHCKY